jgi:hypothetical protein
MTGLLDRLKSWKEQRAILQQMELQFKNMAFEFQRLQLQDYRVYLNREKEKRKWQNKICKRESKNEYVS